MIEEGIAVCLLGTYYSECVRFRDHKWLESHKHKKSARSLLLRSATCSVLNWCSYNECNLWSYWYPLLHNMKAGISWFVRECCMKSREIVDFISSSSIAWTTDTNYRNWNSRDHVLYWHVSLRTHTISRIRLIEIMNEMFACRYLRLNLITMC